ncbi:MAG: serine/threonine-protein kinase [Deltaproteobacteria bacterium]|nr:serine/threonine-protein kinase [Deltaproteobacteria bacterium]
MAPDNRSETFPPPTAADPTPTPTPTPSTGEAASPTDDDEAALATRTGDGPSPAPETRMGPPRRARPVTEIMPGAQIGRYVVVDALGRGGMGVVWKAYDPQLDRNVALKRVRVKDGGDAAIARDRLLREAQALAQLSHPNVVAVHDVGLVGDDVFVAIELVVGDTLRQWLAQHRGEIRRIVEVFIGAGEGLAAAHRAGLVHRDFKPDNVVVGADGRARVLDFGLARSIDAVAAPSAHAPDDDDSPWSDELTPSANKGSSRPSARLTADGAVVGTPRYMAPEQHRRSTADARSDQFSFCVALYEALFATRAFAGGTLRELREHVLAGNLVPPPAGVKVPARWRAAVLRGLATDAAARFPSMDALLAELRRDPRVARRRAVGGAGVAALAGVALFGLVRSPGASGPDCDAADPRLAAAWNDGTRGQLRAAFAASGRSYAPDVLARTEPLLDRFASAWQALRRDACVATHVRGEQSPALLDQQIGCLDRKLDQMSGLIAALGDHPATELIDRAVQAATDLGDVSACSRRAQSASGAPLVADPAARARQGAVLRAIDRAELALRTGAYAAGLAIARTAASDAAGLDAPRVLGAALRARGVLEEQTGAYAEAERSLDQALRAAARAGDHALAAQAWLDLTELTSEREDKHERATALVQAAEVAVGFVDEDAQRPLRASLLIRRGLVDVKSGAFDDARAALEEAVTLDERLYGDGDYRTGGALANLGLVLMKRGDYVRAEEVLTRATAVDERSLGPRHPALSTPLVNLAGVLTYQRKHAQAEAIYARALAIDQAALGPDHPYVADGMTNLGGSLLAQGKPDLAQPYFEKALAIQERALGADHPDVAWTLSALAEVMVARGRFDDARATLARALAIATVRGGAASEPVAQLRQHVAGVDLADGKYADAYRELTATLALFEQLLGRDHPRNAIVLTALAEAAAGIGHDAEVVQLGTRALGLMDRDTVAVADDAKAWVRFLIARARHQLGTDRPAQIAQARAAAASLGPDLESQRQRAIITRWLGRVAP